MQKIILFSLIIMVLSCKTNRNSVGSTSDNCDNYGTIQDFSKLDGCQMLIVLENGEKLNPAKLNPTDFKLTDGQKVKFGYKELPDMMSTCMSEKAIVEITCIETVSEEDEKCVDTKNPFEIDWMDKALDRHNPQQVIKYKYKDGLAYLFKSIPSSFFYDCKGNFLCKHNGTITDDCYQRYIGKSEGKGKIIWQGEGIWD